MPKQVIVVGCICSILLLSIGQSVSATSLTSTIVSKKASLQQSKKQVTTLTAQIKEITNQVQLLDTQLKTAEQRLQQTQQKILVMQEEIQKKEEDVTYLKEKCIKRQQLLKKRLVATQLQPRINLVQKLLLGVSSITNFLERLVAIYLLFQADNNILNQQKQEQLLLKEEQQNLDMKKKLLIQLKTSQQKDKKSISLKKDTYKQSLDVAQKKMTLLVQQVNQQNADLKELEKQALFIQQQVQQQEFSETIPPPIWLTSQNQMANKMIQKNTITSSSTNIGRTPPLISTGGNKNVGSTQPVPPAGESVTVQNEQLIQYGMKFLGVPYVFGGATPDGFDCSGFIYYVFKNNGYDIQRLDVNNYWNEVKKVDNPIPGDLVFFQNTYKPGPSHIGIYVGNGEMLAAEANGISFAMLNSTYNRKHFLGYGRF